MSTRRLPTDGSIAARCGRAAFAMFFALWIAAIAFALFTRNNDFPLFYHPDEAKKVEQIVSETNERNFRHPLLMLETAELATHVWDVPRNEWRQAAIAGRSASAFLASVGVFACAMLGYVLAGWIGLAVVGPTVALCPPLLVYAHYLKEDASLIGGLAVATLGVGLVISSRRAIGQLAATIVLGLGCAMAASGKYVGAAVVAPALLTIVIAPLARWWLWPIRLLLFAGVAVAATVAINIRAFEDPWRFALKPVATDGFEWEFEHGTTGHGGLTFDVPNTFLLRVAAAETMPHVYAMAAIGAALAIGLAIRQRRWPMSRVAVALGSLPVTFALVLSHNTIPFERYGLPLTFFAYALAAVLVSVALSHLSHDRPRVASVVAASTAIIVVVAQGRRCLDFDRRFADDSRQRLRTWLATNVPAGSLVVSDWFAALQEGGDSDRFPDEPDVAVRVINRGFASQAGETVEQLARRRVRYVVAVKSSYGRFFAPGVRTRGDDDGWLKQTRAFYSDLFARGELVWSNIPNPPTNGYVDPEIRVYRIDQLRPANEPPQPPTPMQRWAAEMARRRKAAATQPR